MVVDPVWLTNLAKDTDAATALTAGTLHIWHLHLQGLEPYLEAWASCLSAEERDRMNRFVFERDRIRYGLSRGGLRQLLSQYVNCEPAKLEFEYETRGKPHLCLNGQRAELQFNLSHSGDWVVYGVSCDRAVGIDVEQVRPLRDLQQMAQRCLTAEEQRAFEQLPSAVAQAQFFEYWTGKEAFLKATGQGLTRSMSDVRADLLAGKILPQAGTTGSGQFWHLHLWQPEPSYVGAIVYSGDQCQCRHLSYSPSTWANPG
ncbi:MAG: 4'-phosphopantetheinyl transferase superfamily protein [Cyanobacteria bacterium Co-bin13]|nr:4'-phosphopantetheinyl transferase superfamily protein [Cyanobacteria bacterium Co-bin13]